MALPHDLHAAIASAAFAAAHAATSMSGASHPSHPQINWFAPHHAHSTPPSGYVLMERGNPPAAAPYGQSLGSREHDGSSFAADQTEQTSEALEKGHVSNPTLPHESESTFQSSLQLLIQQHAAELEARRRAESELHEVRRKHDELQNKFQELLVTFHKADVDKCVAVANAKSAEKAAKEREASIERLEGQVRIRSIVHLRSLRSDDVCPAQAAEWRKLATDLLREQRKSDKDKSSSSNRKQ
ncbi:MAG: hypothetical protein SGPRY_005249 [Prymnesium sp.]